MFEAQYVFKQMLATAASGLLTVTSGFATGFSAILLPALKKDQHFPYDASLDSWIASITPLSMMIGCICGGPLVDTVGRKRGHILLALISITSWLIIGFAKNNTSLLIGRFIAGLSIGSNRPVALVYLGEITDPKYRQFTLICTSISLSIGVLISHLLGGYLYWKLCCHIYAGANVLCLVILLYLKESPLWLISQGDTVEGVKSFKWFRGPGVDAEKELQLVLQRKNENPSRHMFKDAFNIAFVKPLLVVLLLSTIQFNGVNVFAFYAQEMLDLTFKGSIDSFTLMLVTDIVRFIVVVLVFACSKMIPRKIFIAVAGFGCSIILFVLAIYLHIGSIYTIWSIIIIVLYMGLGGAVICLAWSFVPELFPTNLRGLGSGMGAATLYLTLFISVKVSPGFMASYGVVALYATYGVITIVNAVIICFILPETNGRTLQDIEDSYKTNKTSEHPT